jgi:hypothetical protein
MDLVEWNADDNGDQTLKFEKEPPINYFIDLELNIFHLTLKEKLFLKYMRMGKSKL